MLVEEITNGETLTAWLKGLPQGNDEQREDARHCAVSIAHRAAMRTLPSIWLWGWSDEGSELTQNSLIALRCALTSEVAAVSLTDAIEKSARHAAQSAAKIYKSLGTSGAASLQATIAGLSSAASRKFDDAVNSAPTACHMTFALGRSVEIRSDASRCLSGIQILEDPLWQNEVPKGVNILNMWRQIREKHVRQGSDWQFWIEWYEKALSGRQQDWDLLTKIALISPEDWDEGAVHVNGQIKQIIAEHNRRVGETQVGSASVETVKAGVARNRHILTLQLDALGEVILQEIERVRSLNSLEPDVRDGLLSALSRMQEAAQEVQRLLPSTGSLTDADAAKIVSWADVIKKECLHWNTEAKKFVSGEPADERVVLAGRIVLASAVAGPLTLLGLGPLAAMSAGAIMLKGKLGNVPKTIKEIRLGKSPE